MEEQEKYNTLINKILLGNKSLFSELYDETILDVYKNVHFLIDDKSDTDDLVQEIYVQLYHSLSKYNKCKPFKPWLMGVVIKQIQAYRRKRWMRLRIDKKAEQYDQGAGTINDFSNGVVEKLTNQQLVNLVNHLPYKLKQVIVLRYLNDHSQEEVAAILEIPLGTVKSRINAGLKKLRTKGIDSTFYLERVRNV